MRNAFLLLSALLCADTLPAQQPTSFSFVYIIGGDTVGTESVTVRDTMAVGVLSMRDQPRVEWTQVMVNRAMRSLSLRVFAPNSASDDDPKQFVSFSPQGDSMFIEQRATGTGKKQAVATKVGTVAFLGNSLLHAAFVANYARSTGRTTVPVLITGGGAQLDASVVVTGDTTTLAISGLQIRTVWVDGVPSVITVPAQGLRVVRVASAAASGAIDYRAPIDAPYTAENVIIPTPRGYSLAGTLTRPKGVSKTPVVITISGSGPQSRDSRLPGIRGYAPFREIADTLGRRGIAVLRFDDRGVGESGGASSRAKATSADFADDVHAVIAYLRTRPDVDGARIALAGHSEGGFIAPMVAVKDPTVRAVALIAGPVYTGRRILEFQNEYGIASAPGLTDAQRDSIRRTVPRVLDSIATANAWFGFFMKTDPAITLRQVKQPTLVLQGDTDQQVTPEQADTIAVTMRRAGNSRVTVRRFPATNHLLLADPSGAPSGYASLADTKVRRDVLGALADWMVGVLK